MNTFTLTADSFSRSWLWTGLLLFGLASAGLGCGSAGGNGDENGADDGLPPPSNLNGGSGNAVISLQWDGTEEAESYNVYRVDSLLQEDDNLLNLLQEGVSQTSFEDTDVENGTTYTYAVTAVGPEGTESVPSEMVQKTPFAKPPDTPED